MLEYIILGFLQEMDLSGYDIKQCMTYSTSNFFDASFGSIYPALKRLEERGLISSKGAVEGSKYKKYYHVLEEGKKEFLNWLAQPVDFSGIKQEYLVKQFFYRYLPKDKVLILLEHFIGSIKETIKKLHGIEKTIEGNADYYRSSTLYYGLDFMSFALRWYERMYKEIQEKQE